jgi:plasmid stabilization system protein ParE
MKLRLDPRADAEIREAAAWYERQRVGLGIEFIAAIDAAVQRIRQQPQRYSRLETLPEEENIRRLLLDRFPYAVIYESAPKRFEFLPWRTRADGQTIGKIAGSIVIAGCGGLSYALHR